MSSSSSSCPVAAALGSSRFGLHSGYFHPLLRQWQSGSGGGYGGNPDPAQLMLPIFLIDNSDAEEEIASMPGVKRMGVNVMIKFVEPLVKMGLKSVLLFAVTSMKKDATGSIATNSKNPVISGIRALTENFPDLLIACDVCLCPYTDHGHCGILRKDGFIDNDKSVAALAAIARAFAEAGAHIIAPSDMMDGRVAAIKEMLRRLSLLNRVAVMSYSVKFASCFYGPFRDAAHSAPASGDRKRYQLPVGAWGLAVRAADRDAAEGADVLMVKPGLAYLDVVRDVKRRHPELPMAIYQVSGEYAMMYHGAQAGAFELRSVLEETMTCMRRSGVDIIISYFTPQLLKWISDDGCKM